MDGWTDSATKNNKYMPSRNSSGNKIHNFKNANYFNDSTRTDAIIIWKVRMRKALVGVFAAFSVLAGLQSRYREI